MVTVFTGGKEGRALQQGRMLAAVIQALHLLCVLLHMCTCARTGCGSILALELPTTSCEIHVLHHVALCDAFCPSAMAEHLQLHGER